MTTNRTAITEKSDALTKFMIANLRAYELLQTDKETSINCLVNYSGQDAAYVENVIYGTEDYDAAMTISLDPCKTAVEAFYETMKANGNIDANTTFDMADHIDTTIYKAALETMLEREPDNTLWTDLAVEFEANNTK